MTLIVEDVKEDDDGDVVKVIEKELPGSIHVEGEEKGQ